MGRLNTDSSTYHPTEISMDAIKVTVPEDAVLTPQKNTNVNSMRVQVKEPQSADVVDLGSPKGHSLQIPNVSQTESAQDGMERAQNIEVPSISAGSESDF